MSHEKSPCATCSPTAAVCPRGDHLIWVGSDFDRAEILRRVRYLPPRWSFRSHYGYQNILYLVAGQVVAAVTGRSWDEFVRERIFVPLGMTASSTSVTALANAGNVATPHADVDERRCGPFPTATLTASLRRARSTRTSPT